LKESDEQRAERLVGEMLRKAGWAEDELKRRRKIDAEKALGGETALRDGNDLALDRWAAGDGPLANSGPCGAKEDFAKD
jgi:hypothetical protein